MDFSIKAFDTKNTLAAAKSGCIAVAVFENKKLSEAAKALDLNGEIAAAVKSGDISGKAGTTLRRGRCRRGARAAGGYGR
jgi:leucyl aminopeptidase